MIPHTFPTIPDATTGFPEMVIYKLASITGLNRWTDYIPVKTVSTSATNQGTTNTGGYQPINELVSTTGKTAWIDYIPCYEDASATTPFTCSDVGYIPIAASV